MNTKRYTLILGWVFLIVGIAGFIPGLLTDIGIHEHTTGFLFGMFPVNATHNLIHMGFGLWGISASKDFDKSKTYCKANAVIYGLLAVAGIIPELNTLFGLVPLYSNDIWLHALIAFCSAFFGFAGEMREELDKPSEKTEPPSFKIAK